MHVGFHPGDPVFSCNKKKKHAAMFRLIQGTDLSCKNLARHLVVYCSADPEPV